MRSSRDIAVLTFSLHNAHAQTARNALRPLILHANYGVSPEKKDSIAGEIKTEVPTINQPEDAEKATLPPNAPLAPPPKPNQNGDSYHGSEANGGHLSKEPNPFENAFGNPAETPGKPQLPGVTSLTSPASLLPGNTPGWPGSLRSGPLSPAMLSGPNGSTNDYFNSDHHFAGSFPTPNESSLRTGLTPGGGGSMFPQPSPNSQAVYNQLQNGGATPGTLDFHRTAMTARAQSQVNSYNNNNLNQPAATSQPQQNPNIQPDLDSKPYNPNGPSQHQQDNHDPFGSHQTNDAANGLFMLAQAGGQQRNQSYQMPQQQPQHQQNYSQQGGQDQRGKGSIGSMSGSTENGDQYSDDAETKPQTRNGRGKKGATGKAANGKRKNEEASSKGPAHKKQRASMGPSMSEEPEDDDDNMDGMDDRKMTDEEKRKNFLERNRYVHAHRPPSL